jgi:hypothetical protein
LDKSIPTKFFYPGAPFPTSRFLTPRNLPSFAIAVSTKKQACGPEARTFRAKSIGPVISDCGLRISDFLGFLFQSAFRNRHSAIWWRAPLQQNYTVLGKKTACPPEPENEPGLMVFARNALASGPGTSRNSIGLTTICRKVKIGKPQGIVAFPDIPGKIVS